MNKAILAGVLIGIGDIAVMSCENKVLSAFLFSVGLLSIIHLGLPLYTGRIGKVLKNKNFYECFKILFFNIVGIVSTCLAFVVLDKGNGNTIMNIANNKFTHGYISLFTAGVLCNVLIHIAVCAKNDIITILCVMGFILCGFEHSIADAGYAFMTFKAIHLIGWVCVLLGNTVGGIVTETLLNERGTEK